MPQHQLRKCWTGRSPTVQKTEDWNLKAEKWTLGGNLRLQTSVSVGICPLNVELGFMR
ncbi:MAG: hypothetical protein IT569_00250 [Leptospiraceae bacterium]|nr:hypothetical protein [Leptospiraceae bacterium]